MEAGRGQREGEEMVWGGWIVEEWQHRWVNNGRSLRRKAGLRAKSGSCSTNVQAGSDCRRSRWSAEPEPPLTASPRRYSYIMGCLHQRRCSIPINDLAARIGLLRHLVNGLQRGTSNPIRQLKKVY